MKLNRSLVTLILFILGALSVQAESVKLKILEIEVLRGQQYYLYINGGSEQGVALGTVVKFYDSVVNSDKLNGEGEIVEVYHSLSKVKILRLNHRLSMDSIVVANVGKENELPQVESYSDGKGIFLQLKGDSYLLVKLPKSSNISVGMRGNIEVDRLNRGLSLDVEVVRSGEDSTLLKVKGGGNLLSSRMTIFFETLSGEDEALTLEAELAGFISPLIGIDGYNRGEPLFKMRDEVDMGLIKVGSEGYIYYDDNFSEKAALVKLHSKQSVELIEKLRKLAPGGHVLFLFD